VDINISNGKYVHVCEKCGCLRRRGYSISTDVKNMTKEMFKKLYYDPDISFIKGTFTIEMNKFICKRCGREIEREEKENAKKLKLKEG